MFLGVWSLDDEVWWPFLGSGIPRKGNSWQLWGLDIAVMDALLFKKQENRRDQVFLEIFFVSCRGHFPFAFTQLVPWLRPDLESSRISWRSYEEHVVARHDMVCWQEVAKMCMVQNCWPFKLCCLLCIAKSQFLGGCSCHHVTLLSTIDRQRQAQKLHLYWLKSETSNHIQPAFVASSYDQSSLQSHYVFFIFSSYHKIMSDPGPCWPVLATPDHRRPVAWTWFNFTSGFSLVPATLGRMGREARQLVSKQVECRKFKLTLLHTASALVPHQTLQQQGILGQEAAVNCPFVPIDWCAGWCCVWGNTVSDSAHAMKGAMPQPAPVPWKLGPAWWPSVPEVHNRQ